MITPADEAEWIAEAVRRSFGNAELPWPPQASGPARLNDLISSYNLVHEEVFGLNYAAVSARLQHWEIHWDDFPRTNPPDLAGFLYANAVCGFIFVRRDDTVPRRRFTAAHELGHYCLHLTPELLSLGQDGVGLVAVDEDVFEAEAASVLARERQANRFAAELLMPEPVCRNLVDRYSGKYGRVPRFLIHQIAGDLLVSREAIAWRLWTLNLIDELPRWLSRHEDVAPVEDQLS